MQQLKETDAWVCPGFLLLCLPHHPAISYLSLSARLHAQKCVAEDKAGLAHILFSTASFTQPFFHYLLLCLVPCGCAAGVPSSRHPLEYLPSICIHTGPPTLLAAKQVIPFKPPLFRPNIRPGHVVILPTILTLLAYPNTSEGAVRSMDPLELACHYQLPLEPIKRSRNASLLSAKSTSNISAPSQLTQQSYNRQGSPLKLSSSLAKPAINASSPWKETTETQQRKDPSASTMADSVHTPLLGR